MKKEQSQIGIMYFPSITVVIGTIFMVYVSYSVYTLSQLFSTLQCTSTPCYTTILARLPKLQLNLFVSTVSNPMTSDVTKIGAIENFDYYKEFTRYVRCWSNLFHCFILKLSTEILSLFSQWILNRHSTKNISKWYNVFTHGSGERYWRWIWMEEFEARRTDSFTADASDRVYSS